MNDIDAKTGREIFAIIRGVLYDLDLTKEQKAKAAESVPKRLRGEWVRAIVVTTAEGKEARHPDGYEWREDDETGVVDVLNQGGVVIATYRKPRSVLRRAR